MSATPIHPSVFFKEIILLKNFTQKEVAKALGVCRLTVNELCQGKRSFTPDTAVKCAKVFGTTPLYWLRLQMQYDLREAEENIDLRQITQLVKRRKRAKR